MGLRSRLRNRIKKALGSESPGPGTAASQTPAAVRAPASRPPPPPARPAPAASASVEARAGQAAPSALASPAPDEAPAPAAPSGAAPAEAGEETPEATPARAPAVVSPPAAASPPAVAAASPPAPPLVSGESSAPTADIAVAQVFASDYATDDAPVRNAHYADAFETTAEAMTVRVYAKALGLDAEFLVEPGEFVLDAAERAGHELPFSCRSGGCLSCSARLEAGTTQMEEQYVLEEEHIEAGYRLLCLTTVGSACVFETDVQEDIE